MSLTLSSKYQLHPQTSFPSGGGIAASHSWGFVLPHSLPDVYPGVPSRSAEIHPGWLEAEAHSCTLKGWEKGLCLLVS